MRKILHVDADCFFAAVEMRDNPSLVGKPIAVGGAPGRRGVIATCSYEARKFGVRSAMPSAHAMRLCPDLQILRPDFPRYKAVSSSLMEILSEYATAIEPLSLDEAFLDVSDSQHCEGSATRIAYTILRRVQAELGITVSAGVAPIKFLAKIASDWRKPNGVFVVPPSEVDVFTSELPVQRLPGVGPVTAQKLQKLGAYQCRDIRTLGLAEMAKHFGSHGLQLHQRAFGIDEREVIESRLRKSLSVERTYAEDQQASQLGKAVPALLQELQARFHKHKAHYFAHKFFVKLKFDTFQQTTLEAPLPSLSQWPNAEAYTRLLLTAWHRAQQPVRLIGLGVRLKENAEGQNAVWQQLNLFPSSQNLH